MNDTDAEVGGDENEVMARKGRTVVAVNRASSEFRDVIFAPIYKIRAC